MQRTVILLMAVSLALAACGGGGEAAESTTSSTTTTTLATTTTTAATTTTADIAAVVTADIADGDPALTAAVAGLYEQALNPGQDSPVSLPAGMAAQFRSRTASTDDLIVTGTAHLGRILDTDIAVVEAGEDVILLAGQAEPPVWDIVGAKLTSLGEPAWYGEGPRMLMVIGSDARPGEKVTGFRADSLHIVATVPETGEGSIVGIPRDSWVATSYGGNAKLTNTMASRGPEVVVDTVEMVTGIDLEGYVVTGFKGFEDLIDAFGGFTIDVPYRMNDEKSFAYFSPGVQEFDGADALAFSRNRTDTPNGDFGRQYNHGLVMLAVMPEVQEMGIDELPKLLEIFTTFVITDLSAADLLTMSAAAYELDPESVTNLVAPGRVGATSGGASVVFLTDSATELFEDVADGVVDGEY